MPKPLAVLALPLAPDLRARVDAQCEVLDVAPGAPREELLRAAGGAEGLLVINNTPIDEALLAAAPRLRVVSGFGVGYDRVDVPAATRHAVAICNTPDVVTEPVVNLTIGLILSLSRRLVEHAAYTREGGWARRERPPRAGSDLIGKTLGIIGLGRIGSEVARRAAPFGLSTIHHDIRPRAGEALPSCPPRPLDALLAESDFVTLHTDLNDSSHHLIGRAELVRMKPTAWLVNTSRGGVVDQQALTAALREGTIAGAALDVLEQEPPEPDEPILTLPNAIVLPHVGTATAETRAAMAALCVDNLLAVLDGKQPPACVNPEALTRARADRTPR